MKTATQWQFEAWKTRVVTEFGLGRTRLDSRPSAAVNSLLNSEPSPVSTGLVRATHRGAPLCSCRLSLWIWSLQAGRKAPQGSMGQHPSVSKGASCSQAQQSLLKHLICRTHGYAAQLNSPGGARPKPRADSRAPYRVLSFHESMWGTSASLTGQEGAPSGQGAGMVLRA